MMNESGKFLPLTVLPVLALLAGCGSGQFHNENDELRRRNLELVHEVRDLRTMVDVRDEHIESLHERLAGQSISIEGADPPRLVKLRFGRYSGIVDTDRNDLLRVYLRTLDQHGRFMPVAGRAVIRVVHLDSDTPAHVLAQRTYEPTDFNRAYRTGIAGTRYTLQLKLPSPLPENLDRAAVDVLFWDGASGIRHRETAIMPIRMDARDSSSSPNHPKDVAPQDSPQQPQGPSQE